MNPASRPPHFPSRRDFLSQLGAGLGGVALAQVLGSERLLGAESESGGAPHHPPRVKRVIQLFMNGGASPMDLFDYKPALFKHAGEVFDPGAGQRVEAPTSEPGKILKPPFEFRQHGHSGRWVISLIPHRAGRVVHPYTINARWRWALLLWFGALGLFTDRCDLMLRHLGRPAQDRPSALSTLGH